MEQSYLLKEYGKYSLFEQCYITAEDRAWYLERINKENKKREEANKNLHTPGGSSR